MKNKSILKEQESPAFFFLISKVCLELFRDYDFSNSTPREIEVGKTKKKEPITLQYLATYQSVESVNLGFFDYIVLCAVCTLQKNKGKEVVFTPKDIFQIFCGEGYLRDCGERIILDISDSIEKLSRVEVEIRCQNQKKEWKKQKDLRDIYKNKILPVEAISIKSKRIRSQVAYQMKTFSPLHDYSAAIFQVASFPASGLSIVKRRTKMSMTQRTLSLMMYLAKTISIMSSPTAKDSMCKIRFDTLYKYADVISATQKERTRETVFTILACWKENAIIQDYCIIGKENSAGEMRTFQTISIQKNK